MQKPKMNLTNNQMALEYAIYMIAGSYFKNVKCLSPNREMKMLLNYKEQSLDNQYRLEEACIRELHKMARKLPFSFFNQTVRAQIVKRDDHNVIVFSDGKTMLVIWGNSKGNHLDIKWEVWTRKKTEEAGDKPASSCV